MTPLLMTLALTAGPTGVGHPPVVYPSPVPGSYPVRPGYPVGRPVFYPPGPVAPPVILPAPHPHRPMTLEEFARCFKPCPGTHEVFVVHPVTCQPVRVCFTLPEGCGHPRVKTGRRWVEFDYGRREVEINFWRNGTVGVKYH